MRRLAILVPTHNRAPLLQRTLSGLARQGGIGADAEIVVVDNNSSDDTRDVCARFAPAVRYLFEPRQGLSYARNAGVAALAHFSPDDVVAFVDDDVEPAEGWAAAIVRGFDGHPDVECVGGRVLPSNAGALPAWITGPHWAPLALQDHGPAPRMFDASNPVGLVGANFAFRKRVFDRVGLFSPEVQRVRDGIGSTEDHDFLRRLYGAGGRALYVPDAVVTTEVPPERMTHEYHRRWHLGHGRFHALMRTPEMEQARRRVLGVPAHLFRSAAADAVAWVRSTVARDSAQAFAAETRLWFFSGFVAKRCLPRR